MVHRNLGVVDRLLRFALAVWWLGPWAPQFGTDWLSAGAAGFLNGAIAVIAWIALAESFLGWCGIHAALGIHECEEECG